MVLVKKRVGAKNNSKKTRRTKDSKLSLPTKLNTPSKDLRDYSFLLYGAKKIGKTSLASKFPGAFFLSCEPGTKALKVYQRPVNTWEEFLGYVDLIESGDHEFKNIVVDTADIAYKCAFSYICRQKVIEHPSDENDYGKTWDEIEQEFGRAALRLIRAPYGVIFISHDTEKEIETREGDTVCRVQPTMDKRAMKVLEAVVDIIGNYAYSAGERVLHIDGTEEMVAGCRIEDYFLQTNGKRVKSIPMGNSSQEAYDNLIQAFSNKQEPSTKPKRKKLQKKGGQ